MTPIYPYTDMQNILLVNKGTSIFAHVRGPQPPKEVEARIIAFLIPYFSEENAFYRYMRALYLEKITQKFDFSKIKITVTTTKQAVAQKQKSKFESKFPELRELQKELDQAFARASERDLFTFDREWKTQIDEAISYINAKIQKDLISSLMWNWHLPLPSPSYEEYRIFYDSQKQAPLRALLEYYGRITEHSRHRLFREGLFDHIKSVHENSFFIDRRLLDNLGNVLEAWKSTSPQSTFIVSPIANRVDRTSQKAASVFSWILGGMLALRTSFEIILRAVFVEFLYVIDAHDHDNFFIKDFGIAAISFSCTLKYLLVLAYLAKVLLSVPLPPQVVRIMLVGVSIINAVALFTLMSYDPRSTDSFSTRLNKVAHCMLIKPVQDALKSASTVWMDRHRTSEWFAHIRQLFHDLSAAELRIKKLKP